MGGSAETDARQALGEGFPKHPLNKIACIGALVANRQPNGWRVDALSAPHVGERRGRPDQRLCPKGRTIAASHMEWT
jgi:hypothetical protein